MCQLIEAIVAERQNWPAYSYVSSLSSHPEVFAETSIIGDTYFDQLARNGHLRRVEDLDLFAGLGIRTIRYPVQWERVAPRGLENADWTWTDERLGRLRTLGIRPIVGLVHHGSGPQHTSLTDPSFAEGLATFARAVANWSSDLPEIVGQT